MQFYSFDLRDPVFELADWKLSIQIVTLENIYGLDPAQTHELEEQLRISDEIIRHMLVLPVAKSLSAPIFVPAPQQGQAPVVAMSDTQQSTADADDSGVADADVEAPSEADDIAATDETADEAVEPQMEDAEPAQ